jgi:hypothetical protein
LGKYCNYELCEIATRCEAHPSFKLPRRKKLFTTLLDNVYEETKQEVDKLIEETEYYSLVSDGW